MRHLVLVLLLAACSAYPQIHWPSGDGAVATPPLLPQSELMSGAPADDQGGALVARAAGLRDWARSVAR